jgi:hypothetical protein
MITVGYGDILPKSENEMMFCVFNMIISCAVFGNNKFKYIKFFNLNCFTTFFF